jgi:protein arginine kinase
MLQSILTHAIPVWLSHQGPDSDVVISTRIRISRTIAGHPFPGHSSLHQRSLVFDEIAEAFRRPGLGDSFNCVNFNNLDERQRRFLAEERRATFRLSEVQGDRGVIHDRTGRICVMVNDEDHIRMQGLDSGCCARELWAELDAIDDAIAMQIEYAFDNRRGFLVSRPSEAGTGLRVSFLAHLPALVMLQSIDAVVDDVKRLGMSASGFSGQSMPATGALMQLSKSAGIGPGESLFCDDMETVMHGLVDSERKARERLLADKRKLLTEKISGAFSALCIAARIEVEEFLALSSWLRLGIECTLFDKCTMEDLNRLTLFVQPAHLQTCLKKDMDEEEIPQARAELVRLFFTRTSTE